MWKGPAEREFVLTDKTEWKSRLEQEGWNQQLQEKNLASKRIKTV